MAFRSTEHCVFSQHVNTWKRSNFKHASWFDVRNAVWDEIHFSIPKGMSITRTNEEVMVRENMPREMLRQKKYHDAKVSIKSFKPRDIVCAYFPIRKSGRSPNLTSYCIGEDPSKPRRNFLRSFILCRVSLVGKRLPFIVIKLGKAMFKYCQQKLGLIQIMWTILFET